MRGMIREGTAPSVSEPDVDAGWYGEEEDGDGEEEDGDGEEEVGDVEEDMEGVGEYMEGGDEDVEGGGKVGAHRGA